jgi:hypothetical protein
MVVWGPDADTRSEMVTGKAGSCVLAFLLLDTGRPFFRARDARRL